uniref:Anaphase-promoting complex subunit 4 WD40 domain-containing protein n=1 Tax=Setaria digitata TaxID=48799 RepID=A0A915Q1S3_9BILA
MVTAPQSSLAVAVALWGRKPPKHRINCLLCFKDDLIVTGANDGALVVWEKCDKNLQAQMMLLGHNAPITALSATDVTQTSTRFVSASADGQLTLWDSTDGRCIDSNFMAHVHRHIVPYRSTTGCFSLCRLYCIGDYAEVVVIDPQDMNILFTLNSRVEPDWIAAFTLINQPTKQDAVLGMTACGMVKVWVLLDLDKNELPTYETESRNVGINEVCSVSWHPSTPFIFLIFSSNAWQVFQLADLNRLVFYFSEEQICDGKLLTGERSAVAHADGSVYIYQLPHFITSSSNNASSRDGMEEHNDPSLLMILQNKSTSCDLLSSHMTFCISDPHLICQANAEDVITLWEFDETFLMQSNKGVIFKQPDLETSIRCQWNNLKNTPPSIYDGSDDYEVTATYYVSGQGRLLIGRGDGVIILLYGCDAISRQLMTSSEDLSCQHLYGHTAPVTCFLYPHEEHPRYDQQILVSGSSDFSVITWNLNTGSRLYRFCIQGGPVLRMLIPPETCNVAALLSLKENKCLLLASRQLFPIVDVKWRPLDNFLLLKCEDETVYVWQMDTASLERIVNEQMSEEIMTACDEQIGVAEINDEAGASQAVQMLRALKNKNISVVKQIATGNRDGKVANTTEKVLELPPPMSIRAMTKSPSSPHLVFFNIDSLIAGLLLLENELLSGENLENKSLSTILMGKQQSDSRITVPKIAWQTGSNLYMDIAKLCMSLLYAWNLDADLDEVCLKKLRLVKPSMPLSFGIESRQGHLALYMPTGKFNIGTSFDNFSSSVRWSTGSSLTTTHLLTVIALANTLMSLHEASFDTAKKNILARNSSLRPSGGESHESDLQLKQGWSLIAALHCCLLPDLIKPKKVRMAAQALLTRELTRLSVNGRRRLVESWSAFLPTLLDPALSIFGSRALVASMNTAPGTALQPPPIPCRKGEKALPDPTVNVDVRLSKEAGVQQIRRNQATSLVLLGVIGAEFPEEMSRMDISRATAQSLLELLIAPPTALLPFHSPLRRAAVDLIGRGFSVWQPHLDISKLLLILLELATSTDKQPIDPTAAILTPSVDVCHTARHALSLIATSRPPAVITALSKEVGYVNVARYNSMAQHQAIQHSLSSPLLKCRIEVLRIIELLSEKEYTCVAELIIPVGDILVHCLDASLLKHKSLSEIFPPITRFYMVAYCPNTRRIAFGGRNGTVVVHELRAAKAQILHAHKGAVTAVAFSEDGKFLATYGAEEAKLSFWQTSQTFLGIGQSQLKCIKSQSAPGIFPVLSPSGTHQPFRARLVWISLKSVHFGSKVIVILEVECVLVVNFGFGQSLQPEHPTTE